MTTSEWRDKKLAFIVRKYGPYAVKWEKEGDDRWMFFNMYKMMSEGLESITDETPRFVQYAVGHLCKEYQKDMDEILERFKDR